jgi:hypothetical protein
MIGCLAKQKFFCGVLLGKNRALYYMESSVFKLSDLQYRREPKQKQGFATHIRKKGEEEEKEVEDSVDVEREGRVEIAKVHRVKFTDNVSDTLVDRSLILKRLKRPVENKVLSKASQKSSEPVEDEDEEEERIEKRAKIMDETLKKGRKEADEEPEGSIEERLEKAKESGFLKERVEAESILKTRAKKVAVAVASASHNEAEPIETEEGVPLEVPKKSKKIAKKTEEEVGRSFDLSTEKIGDLLVRDRLPPPRKYAVPVSSYYMNNRKIYISELAKLFRPYSERIAAKATELSCSALQSANQADIDFELLSHQLVIRDYLNLYTPYRGLLLYHGLGSGKTCSSIGLAEGMKSGKKVVLMTPASLKMNFFNELKKCGDVLYKKNQFWEFISIEGDVRRGVLLAQILGLDVEYVRSKGGAWLMNVKKRANFAILSDSDQKSVDQQIDRMIRNKYLDINYNGLQERHLNELTKGGKVNPFDNKVVIVDEAHNLVSRIANTGKNKKSIAYRLYKALMDATNAKIIFLTGTPIINTPREIAILFNMLRGFIKTWTFSLETTTSKKINTEILADVFRERGLAMYDYIEYTTNKLVITRNPFGFVNVYKSSRGDEKWKSRATEKKGGSIKASKRTIRKRIVLTDSEKSHKEDMYVENIDDEDPERKLDREYNELNNIYEGGGALEDYTGVRLDEMGNISDAEFEKRLIGILNDMEIRVVGKPVVIKNMCLPDDAQLFEQTFINGEKGELINTDVLKRRILGLTSYFRSAQEQLLPAFVKTSEGGNYHIVNVDMSDYQFEEYEKIRKDERAEEKRKRKQAKKAALDELDDKSASTYRIYSRSACNFVFPPEYPRPVFKAEKGYNDFDVIERRSQDDYFEGEEGLEGLEGVERPVTAAVIQEKTKETYDFLKFDPARKRSKEYLTADQLSIYSPKYLTALQNIQDESNRGLHLVYSQFKTLEGIGIFKTVLESNGFVEFKLVKIDGQWDIDNFEKDPEKPRFARYTGDESAEEKDIVRNIYNGAWHLVPPSIVEKIKERNADNLYGEVIKVLMITASGAEGINLRNTRFVHIIEPYWNMVRVDQVVGRARRICSHEDLPEAMRTVEVFIYLCRATPEQIEKNIELKINDLSKLAYSIRDEKRGREIQERVPFITDQYMLEIAHIKDALTKQILTTVKETAIDCSLYNNNPDEPLVCYGFGRVEPQSFASYPTLERDTQEKPAQRTEKKELTSLKIGEVKYAVDKKTLIVYDMESYKRAKEKRGELVALGTYDPKTKSIRP